MGVWAGFQPASAVEPPSVVRVKQFGTEGDDFGNSVAVGPDGAIYVAGTTWGDTDTGKAVRYPDAFLAKFNASGEMEWIRRFGSPGKDSAQSVTVDVEGDIYVAGWAGADMDGQSLQGETDAMIVKFAPDGKKLWTRLLGTPDYDMAYGIAAGPDSSVYVAGWTGGNLAGLHRIRDKDVFLAKYGADGGMIWLRLLGAERWDVGWAVSADRAGNAFVAGYTEGDLTGILNAGNEDAFLARYNATGVKLWVRTVASPAWESSTAVYATGAAVYLSGYSDGSLGPGGKAGYSDVFLARYGQDGKREWITQSGTDGWDRPAGIAEGADGRLYVAGQGDGAIRGLEKPGGKDIYIAVFDAEGRKVGEKLIGTARDEYCGGMARGADGALYVAGSTAGDFGLESRGGYDAFLLKLE